MKLHLKSSIEKSKERNKKRKREKKRRGVRITHLNIERMYRTLFLWIQLGDINAHSPVLLIIQFSQPFSRPITQSTIQSTNYLVNHSVGQSFSRTFSYLIDHSIILSTIWFDKKSNVGIRIQTAQLITDNMVSSYVIWHDITWHAR